MSIADKITRLQAAKTAIGTAITAKGGTVAAGDGFEDFAADVGTIPAGGTNFRFDHVRSAHYMYGQINSSGAWSGSHVFPSEIIVPKMENCVYAARMFCGNDTTQHIVLGGFSHEGVNLMGFFRGATLGDRNVELLEDIYPTSMEVFFESIFGVYEHPSGFSGVGRFNCSLCVNDSCFRNFGGGYVSHIEFVENTIKVNFASSIGARNYIDNESLISIANGLNEGVTSKSITVDSSAKTRFQSITGTVSFDTTNTFHIFTADAGGSVTLADFITDTKGWTIA